jgi:lipid-A-disaccharide synthase
MANLIAGREVVPELIQSAFRPDALATQALALLESPGRLAAIRTDLAEVRQRLGPPGASGRAADIVIRLLLDTKKA